MEFGHFITITARVIETAGILVTLLGTAYAAVRAFGHGTVEDRYKRLREDIGRAILLGLELLVAADIIRTVSEVPSIEKALVLALIVLIRTFLSFTLSVELEGRWPWQRGRKEA